MHTFSSGKKVYSVDLMLAYVNIYKPKYKNILVEDLLHVLEYKGWGNPEKNIYYSALDVINNPGRKKYKHEIDRIKNADLKYPIILHKNYIVDGVHRLSKAFLDGKKTIKAYVFTDIDKFLVSETGKTKFETYDLIKIFNERF